MIGVTKHESSPAVLGITLLRVVVGLIMMAHGFQKLAGFSEWQQNVAAMGIPLPELMAPLAMAGELGGGLGLVLGFLTPVASFGVACTMAVAIITVHLPHGLFAKNNGFEFPLTLLCVALFFLLRGPGPISVDRLFGAIRRGHKDDRSAASFRQPREHHT